MSAAPEQLEKKSILFENGRSAQVLQAGLSADAKQVLETLEIPAAQAAIIVGGGTTKFGDHLKNRLLDLFSRGVAQAAQESKAILLDQGAREGVDEILGQSVADRGRKTPLVGVVNQEAMSDAEATAAGENQTLDANHTHFVVNQQGQPRWQAEMLCSLAKAASQNPDWILTVLAGGELEGPALNLALETVRQGWKLIVIEGSGPLADQIVKIKKDLLELEKRTGRFWKWLRAFRGRNPLQGLRETNPRLFEIISDGKIFIIDPNFSANQLRNLIKGLFQPPKEQILWTAWQRFADYDTNSVRHRRRWRLLKDLPLYLGAISTLLVLIYSTTNLNGASLIEGNQSSLWANAYTGFMRGLGSLFQTYPGWDLFFRFIIILFPIAASIALGIETRLKLGSKYILLRGAAESIKRGIYSYRVLKSHGKKNPDIMLPFDAKDLAIHLEKASKVLQDTDVNESAYVPYGGPIPPNMFGAEEYDDGFSPLDPETYVRIRIGDQLKFFTLRTIKYERQIRSLQIVMLILGGIGTFLAAVGAQYWLPLTAAIISAMTAFLEYRQLEQILTKYNLTKASLENTQAWWLALPDSERNKDKNVQKLVRNVEAILESENQGWVQYVSQVQKEAGKGDGTHAPIPGMETSAASVFEQAGQSEGEPASMPSAEPYSPPAIQGTRQAQDPEGVG
ncbi:MAG: SLATT domain-containing protein [Bacteroidota bacterium]